MTKQKSKSDQVLEKKALLESVKLQLKKEFFGIDAIIDSIITSLSSWYLFPEIQNKPVIINLWGLTGVGKSSLVKRLSELIGFENKYYRFDLGSLNNDNPIIKSKLEDIYEKDNGYPIIIGFDEFQYAKNINEDKKEIESVNTRVIWDILDSGIFYINNSFRYVEKLYDLRDKIQFLMMSGVKLEKGEIVSGHEKVIDLLRIKWRVHFDNGKKIYDTKDLHLIEDDYFFPIYYIRRDLFKNEHEISDYFKDKNDKQILQFLDESIEYALRSSPVDCRKSLVFVMGNLDEAFWMSGDFNPDLGADEFHEQSLKINIAHIKQALSYRFRSEQIARLGNTHIIYPSFSSKTYVEIIRNELVRQKIKFNEFIKAEIIFTESIVELVYKEGVFPTQGTRPLFTTIQQLIDSLLAKIYYEVNMHAPSTDKIVLTAENEEIHMAFYANKKLLSTLKEKAELNLGKLRKNRKDDMQAITAVHEAGHVVLSIALLNNVPEYAYSITADSESSGFVYAKMKWKYTSKKQIKNRIAVMLGGYMAEQLIFGEENVTTGAESDLYKATTFATDMIKNAGMGSILATVQVKSVNTNQLIHDTDLLINEEVIKLLEEAKELARATLKEETSLLTEIANYLADHPKIRKEEIKEFTLKHGSKINSQLLFTNEADCFYRNILKQKVESSKKKAPVLALPYFQLNKHEHEGKQL